MAKAKTQTGKAKKTGRTRAGAKRASRPKTPTKRKTAASKKSTRKAASTTRVKSTKKKTSTQRSAKTTTKRKSSSNSSAQTTPSRTRANRSGAGKTGAAKPKRTATNRVTPRAAGSNHDSAGKGAVARPQGRRLTPTELESFRQLLLDKRAELVGDVSNLRRDALGGSHTDNGIRASSMPTHMADLGSDNWEQEFNLGLLGKDIALLREIDEALDRIADGTYGRCLGTDRMITKSRLRAKPWARYCIEYAEQLERGLVSRHDDRPHNDD